MDVDLLVKLSNSDALAGNEDEVRELIQVECAKYLSETFRDGLEPPWSAPPVGRHPPSESRSREHHSDSASSSPW